MRKRCFYIGAFSDRGCVKKTNQDNILVKIGEDEYGEFGLFVVADGMGGLAHGDIASRMIIDEFKAWWKERLSTVVTEGNAALLTISRELDILIAKVNSKVRSFGNDNGERLGSTLSLLLAYRDNFIIKHIGDSRIYSIKNRITRLTEDHSWVAEQLRLGILQPEEAGNHPFRNALTRCVGVDEKVLPYEASGKISLGEVFLLCSDGLYKYVCENEILSTLEKHMTGADDIQAAADELLEMVKDRGAGDNVSLIAVLQGMESTGSGLFERMKHFFLYEGRRMDLNVHKTY